MNKVISEKKLYLVYFLFLFSLLFSYGQESQLLEPYPLQSGRKKTNDFDSNGVIMVDYGGNIGKKYNPVSICQYAHRNYMNYYNTKQKKYRENFFNQVKWLIANQKIKNGMGVWEYNFENKSFNTQPPWISAMAQGLAISVLSEAYSLTKKEIYLTRAQLALECFNKSVEEGGVVSYQPNGDIWYEEVASKEGGKILNGFIFSLAGIADFYWLTGSEEAKFLVEQGLKSLHNHIDKYDYDFVSRYSLLPYNVKWGYNKIHVLQLIWAYSVTRKERFLEYARKFASYDPITYQVKVSSTKNPKYGSHRLNDNYMFYSYWSSDNFPINIDVQFSKLWNIKGIVFFCVSDKTCPKDYFIDLNKDKFIIQNNTSQKIEIKNSEFIRKENSKTYIRKHTFKQMIPTKELSITINSDNGNDNVAIREIQFIASKEKEVEEELENIKKRINEKLKFNIK